MATPRQVQRQLKMRGLECRADALQAILSVLRREADPARALEKVVDALKEQVSASRGLCVVDRESVQRAVLELSKTDDDIILERLAVHDAFSVPETVFARSGGASFHTSRSSGGSHASPLHPSAKAKAELFRERYLYVKQRVLRNPLFTPSLNGERVSDRVALTPIEELTSGGNSSDEIHHILGMLSCVDEGQMWIEDLTGKLPLNLKHAKAGSGLFTEGCMVIAVGHLQFPDDMEVEDNNHDDDDAEFRTANEDVNNNNNNPFSHNNSSNAKKALSAHPTTTNNNKRCVFAVHLLGMPPAESREASELAHPGCSYTLMGRPVPSTQDLQAMKTLEVEAEDSTFVLLSDVHLDDPDTMESLRVLFQGFRDFPPQLFVLMGDFSRRPFGYGSAASSSSSDQITGREYGELFERLGDLMSEAPELLDASVRWVFVPGPRDPSASPKELLPRPSLPLLFCEKLMSRLPHTCRVSFTSNPTRVFFYNQEICIFRNNLISKMRRNCILPPPKDADVSELFVKTLIDQAHLCPLPMDTSPVFASYERALRLFPLPDVVVMADYYEQYQWRYSDCGVINPGSFSSDGSFVFYRPSSMTTEFSRVKRGGASV